MAKYFVKHENCENEILIALSTKHRYDQQVTKRKWKILLFRIKVKKQTTCSLPQFGYSKSMFEYVAHEDLNET